MNPFIKDTRNDGTTFYTLSADAPEGLLDAVGEAHGDTTPNDWIWEECAAAWNADEDLTDSDALHEYADGRVDIYTKAIYQWGADMCLTDTYSNAESEADDSGAECTDVEKRFQVIQYYAIMRVASVIAEFVIAKFKSTLDTEEGDS